MKKLISSLCLLFSTLVPVLAQVDETFQFVDANGNVVSNGATITATQLVEDEFLGNNINSGLHVKNVSGASAMVRVVYSITTLDNGSLQVCFPVTCNSQMATGSYETTPGTLNAGTIHDLQSEWFPMAFGSCTVSYRLEVMQQVGVFPHQSYEKVADGPTVTVMFTYADPAAISNPLSNAQPTGTNSFDLLGRQHACLPLRGLKIVNGRKVFCK